MIDTDFTIERIDITYSPRCVGQQHNFEVARFPVIIDAFTNTLTEGRAVFRQYRVTLELLDDGLLQALSDWFGSDETKRMMAYKDLQHRIDTALNTPVPLSGSL